MVEGSKRAACGVGVEQKALNPQHWRLCSLRKLIRLGPAVSDEGTLVHIIQPDRATSLCSRHHVELQGESGGGKCTAEAKHIVFIGRFIQFNEAEP